MSADQRTDDDRYLDILGLLHWVLGGIVGFFSLFPVLHVIIGLLALSGGMPEMPPAEARLFGTLFLGVGTVLILLGAALATCLVVAGFSLRARRRHTFCVVAAALACLFMPLGTVLGVFTLVLLLKPGVSAAFAARRTGRPAPAA